MKIVALAGNKGHGKDEVASLLERDFGFVVLAFGDQLKRVTQRLFRFESARLWGTTEQRDALEPERHSPYFWSAARDRAEGVVDLYAESLFRGRVPRTELLGALYTQIDMMQAFADRFSIRKALQHVGSEWGRAQYPNVWADYAMEQISALASGGLAYDRVLGLFPHYDAIEGVPTGVAIPDNRHHNEAACVHRAGGRVYWVDAAKRCPVDHSHSSEPKPSDFEGIADGTIDNNGPLAALPGELTRVAGAYLHG